MDDIHEYLLLKGVDAVSIHGGKEQEERNEAIRLFKVGCRLYVPTAAAFFFAFQGKYL